MVHYHSRAAGINHELGEFKKPADICGIKSGRATIGNLTDAQIGKVMSPIGLDIGARTPEETAIAICAEVIANRTGRRAASLRDTSGPIH